MRPTALLLVGLLLLATVAATAGFVVRVPCPQCLGEGLVTEPPPDVWKTRWVRARDLTPVPCSVCSDCLKVGLIRQWQWGTDRAPKPPIYRTKDQEAFTEQRRGRIAELRDMAVRGMGREYPPYSTSLRPDLLPVLAAALDDEDGKVRAHAMLAVAQMNHEKALPILVGALKHEDDNVQGHACMGLGRLGRSPPIREAAVQALTKVYDSGEETELTVRLRAARALFDLEALRSADLFMEALKEHRLDWSSALKVFVHFQRKEVTFALIKQMARQNPSQTAEYGQALERLTGEKLGNDPVIWYRWFEKNRDTLPPQLE